MKCSNPNCNRSIGPCRLSVRLVQQAALLFRALPRCVRGRCTKATTKAERAELYSRESVFLRE
jgi:hypothetical protein